MKIDPANFPPANSQRRKAGRCQKTYFKCIKSNNAHLFTRFCAPSSRFFLSVAVSSAQMLHRAAILKSRLKILGPSFVSVSPKWRLF